MSLKVSNNQSGTRWLRLLGWLAPVVCLALAWVSSLALEKEQEVLETRLFFAQKTGFMQHYRTSKVNFFRF